ncbi:MAG: nucleoid-associated protein [Ignavibacteriaceae bacterium]|nr:nucleoid-associated protein [Ignavibacteriaceae bacterium]
MIINNIIVHEIKKNANEIGATNELSNSLLPIDENSTNLIETLDEKYGSTNIAYGIFKNEVCETFPKGFGELNVNHSVDNFINFSQEAIKKLTDQIRNISSAKGGYFVFGDYNKSGVNFFSIFLIRNTKGILFQKNGANNSFLINPTTHIDLDKLAMACRINKTRYTLVEGKYISFIKNKLPDISEYFINWIAATEIESSTVYTNELYKLTGHIDKPLLEDGTHMSLDHFRNNVYDFISSRPDGIVNLHNLGEHFYQNPQYVIDFVNQNEYTLDTEFKIDKRKMKKFIRVDIKADGIQLRFTRGEYNRLIRIDDNNPNVIIIESERFANKLREEINNNE